MEYSLSEIWGFFVILIGLILTILGIIERFINLKAKSKEPHVKLENRVTILETWKNGVDQRLGEDSDRFRKIEEGNKATQKAILALMDTALSDNGCKDELVRARQNLHNYLFDK